jgi:acyl-CoA thioester hydrolase
LAEPFRYAQRVRYHECDPQGVVFNAHYLAYFDIALTELWREVGGYEEMISEGTDMVVAEATVRYRAPLRFDDEFEVAIELTRIGETSMTSAFRIERDGALTTEGEVRHVFVTAGEGAKTPIPEQVRSGLRSYSAQG